MVGPTTHVTQTPGLANEQAAPLRSTPKASPRQPQSAAQLSPTETVNVSSTNQATAHPLVGFIDAEIAADKAQLSTSQRFLKTAPAAAAVATIHGIAGAMVASGNIKSRALVGLAMTGASFAATSTALTAASTHEQRVKIGGVLTAAGAAAIGAVASRGMGPWAKADRIILPAIGGGITGMMGTGAASAETLGN